jgi:hypothetical protein
LLLLCCCCALWCRGGGWGGGVKCTHWLILANSFQGKQFYCREYNCSREDFKLWVERIQDHWPSSWWVVPLF